MARPAPDLQLRHGDILGISRGGFLICDYGMEERKLVSWHLTLA